VTTDVLKPRNYLHKISRVLFCALVERVSGSCEDKTQIKIQENPGNTTFLMFVSLFNASGNPQSIRLSFDTTIDVISFNHANHMIYTQCQVLSSSPIKISIGANVNKKRVCLIKNMFQDGQNADICVHKPPIHQLLTVNLCCFAAGTSKAAIPILFVSLIFLLKYQYISRSSPAWLRAFVRQEIYSQFCGRPNSKATFLMLPIKLSID
jgi:hypothetical protein